MFEMEEQSMNRIKSFAVTHIRLTIIAFAFLIALLFFFGHGRNKAYGNSNYLKQVTSIEIEEGDTLWSIAGSFYVPECGSMQDYIAEIKKTNHLTTDVIHSGCYLVVPYYVPVN